LAQVAENPENRKLVLVAESAECERQGLPLSCEARISGDTSSDFANRFNA